MSNDERKRGRVSEGSGNGGWQKGVHISRRGASISQRLHKTGCQIATSKLEVESKWSAVHSTFPGERILLDVIILEATGNPATEEETEKKKIS